MKLKKWEQFCCFGHEQAGAKKLLQIFYALSVFNLMHSDCEQNISKCRFMFFLTQKNQINEIKTFRLHGNSMDRSFIYTEMLEFCL